MLAPIRVETGWPKGILSPNGRAHHYAKARARRIAKAEAYLATAAAVLPSRPQLPEGKLKVTIFAHPAVDRRRDDDNLVASCKAQLDGIAAALNVDDSRFAAPLVVWGDKHPGGRLFFQIEEAR
jgi:crossover junction endodeoxyribonuclease RusA